MLFGQQDQYDMAADIAIDEAIKLCDNILNNLDDGSMSEQFEQTSLPVEEAKVSELTVLTSIPVEVTYTPTKNESSGRTVHLVEEAEMSELAELTSMPVEVTYTPTMSESSRRTVQLIEEAEKSELTRQTRLPVEEAMKMNEMNSPEMTLKASTMKPAVRERNMYKSAVREGSKVYKSAVREGSVYKSAVREGSKVTKSAVREGSVSKSTLREGIKVYKSAGREGSVYESAVGESSEEYKSAVGESSDVYKSAVGESREVMYKYGVKERIEMWQKKIINSGDGQTRQIIEQHILENKHKIEQELQHTKLYKNDEVYEAMLNGDNDCGGDDWIGEDCDDECDEDILDVPNECDAFRKMPRILNTDAMKNKRVKRLQEKPSKTSMRQAIQKQTGRALERLISGILKTHPETSTRKYEGGKELAMKETL